MPTTTNRRAHPRTHAEIACKLLQNAECRYRAALTADVSAGGALLTLRTPKPLKVGESLELSLNWDGRPLMSRTELVKATVVRAGPMLEQSQQVAVRFDEPQLQAERLLGADAA
jgi:c-di-GMP-binding flagellar brake protein YcgR